MTERVLSDCFSIARALFATPSSGGAKGHTTITRYEDEAHTTITRYEDPADLLDGVVNHEFVVLLVHIWWLRLLLPTSHLGM